MRADPGPLAPPGRPHTCERHRWLGSEAHPCLSPRGHMAPAGALFLSNAPVSAMGACGSNTHKPLHRLAHAALGPCQTANAVPRGVPAHLMGKGSAYPAAKPGPPG